MYSPEIDTLTSVGEASVTCATEAALSEWIRQTPSENSKVEAKLFAKACLTEGLYLSVSDPELWSKSVDFTDWLVSACAEGTHNVHDSLIMCGVIRGKGLYDLMESLSLNSVLAEAKLNVQGSCFSYTREKMEAHEKAFGENNNRMSAVFMRRKEDKKYIHSGVLIRDSSGSKKLYMLHTYPMLPWIFATPWSETMEIYRGCDHAIIEDYKSTLDFMSRHDIEQNHGSISVA